MLHLSLSNSVGFTLLLAVGGAMAVSGCCFLPGWWAVAASLILVIYLVYEWRLHIARRHHRSPIACWLDADDNWSVEFASGKIVDHLQAVGGVFCHPLLVLVSLRAPAGESYRLIVPRDAAPVEGFRRLRRRLSGTH